MSDNSGLDVSGLILSQFLAALRTLEVCIESCPPEAWDRPVGNLKFCQVAFHTLIFVDIYLGTDEHDSLRLQPFHLENTAHFRDYEELRPVVQAYLYEREFIDRYLAHCRDKARRVIGGETVEQLAAPCTFSRRNMSRAELHIYNLRHIQHHAAQLSLRLRLDHDVDVKWVSKG